MNRPVITSLETLEAEDPDELLPTRYSMERGLLVMGERTEIVLVRHAQQIRTMVEATREGGPGLSELGREQARLTGEHLAGDSITAVYCSDMNRTVETASIIAGILTPGVEPTRNTLLREVDMYSRDRGGADVSAATQTEAGEKFARTLRFDSFPNTETSEDFRARLHTAIEHIASAHVGERVVVVSHAGAISAFVAGMISADPDMFYFAGHASVNRVFWGDNRFVTHALNEVTHLRAHDALTF